MFKGLLLTLVLTAYCPCPICCGEWADGITSSLVKPVEGFTLASRQLPVGTILRIEGKDFMVQDKGGPEALGVDVFFEKHEDARTFGAKKLQVEVRHVPKGPKSLNKFLMALPITGQVADIGSTHWARSRGLGEGNPAMKWALEHPPAFEAAKLSVGVGVTMAGRHLHKKGHPGWAKGVLIGGGVMGWGPAIFNFLKGR